jgi:mannose-1-phosphate guanylyltransferase/mannose-6-phosphate isomerase
MLWNIGIFCGPVKVFIEQYKKYAPGLYAEVQNFVDGKQSYDSIQNISVDHAIMEKSDAIYVIPAHFDWSDVGNLETFLSLHTNTTQESVINIDSHNNLVCEVPEKNAARKKVIALIGIRDLCIVDTEDALLIAHKDEVEKVKALQAELKAKKLQEYL